MKNSQNHRCNHFTCSEGVLDILHRRHELRREARIRQRHHLVADSDDDDLASRVVGQHIRVHPIAREIRVGGERRNIAVGGADHYSDAGVRQRLDDRRVGAVQPHLLDARRLQELRRRLRRREVVRHLAVIHSDERLRILAK